MPFKIKFITEKFTICCAIGLMLFMYVSQLGASQISSFGFQNSIQRNGKWNYWKLNWISVFCFENCLTSLQVSHSFIVRRRISAVVFDGAAHLGYCCDLFPLILWLFLSLRVYECVCCSLLHSISMFAIPFVRIFAFIFIHN